tara:strand:+ start:3103 stop:4083 length:981 start_codon:yes stop_codon:yes gene_type:complete
MSINTVPKKSFVAVSSKYYKYQAALAVLDHANSLRNGFTASPNVHRLYSSENITINRKGCESPIEALEMACKKYKKVTGRKIRSDFNALFEHVVVLSEENYSRLEKKYGKTKVKKHVANLLVKYAKSVKQEYGFEPLAISLHLDEGHVGDDGRLIRNIHGHVSLFNYDFEKKIAPLRHLMSKGKRPDGRTNDLNENFVKLQDIAAQIFSPLGFSRGVSKSVTSKEHLSKEEFVRQKMSSAQKKLEESEHKFAALREEVINAKVYKNQLDEDIFQLKKEKIWLTNLIGKLGYDVNALEKKLKRFSGKNLRRKTSERNSKNTVVVNRF